MAVTRSTQKRARSSSPEPTGEPAALRRRLNFAPVDIDVARNGDVVLNFEHLTEGTDGNFVQDVKRMRVSAAHLTQTSRVFGAMLDGRGFRETNTLREQGWIELDLEDDYEAFLVIAHAIHGNSRTLKHKLPKMSIALLAKVATVVDKYEWHDAIEMYAESWIRQLKVGYPTTMSSDTLMWLWISWVFQHDLDFTALTKIAMRQTTGNDVLSTDEYPLPLTLVDAIKRRAGKAVVDIKAAVSRSLKKLQTGPQPDSKDGIAAKAITYGLCYTQANDLGLLKPDDNDHSFQSLAESIRNMIDSTDVHFRRSGTDGSKTVAKSFKSSLIRAVKAQEEQLDGLSLDDKLDQGKGTVDAPGHPIEVD